MDSRTLFKLKARWRNSLRARSHTKHRTPPEKRATGQMRAKFQANSSGFEHVGAIAARIMRDVAARVSEHQADTSQK